MASLGSTRAARTVMEIAARHHADTSPIVIKFAINSR